MGRSIASVVAGFITTTVLAVGADALLVAAAPGSFAANGHVASAAILAAMLAYTFAFAVVGCFVTAKLAGRRPMFHALVLGGIALAITILASIAGSGTAPAWFHAIAIAQILPAAWIGGKLAELRTRENAHS